MANVKISELANATLPLTGTEVIEVVQSGVNKKVAVSEVGGGGAVDSVNGQTGAVTGLEEVSNKATTLASPDNTKYPTTQLIVDSLATKQDTLVSATNLKTINGNSLLGSGNIQLDGIFRIVQGVPSATITGTTTNTIAVSSVLIPAGTVAIGDIINIKVGVRRTVLTTGNTFVGIFLSNTSGITSVGTFLSTERYIEFTNTSTNGFVISNHLIIIDSLTSSTVYNWTGRENIGIEGGAIIANTNPNWLNNVYFYVALANPNISVQSFISFYEIEVIKST